MNEAVKLLLSLSLSGSILAVLLFVLRPFIRHIFSKSIQYLLWVIVLLRLIMPFSFEASIMNQLFYGEQKAVTETVHGVTPQMEKTDKGTSDLFLAPESQKSGEYSAFNSKIDATQNLQDLFNKYALFIWFFGFIIVLASNLFGYMRFSKHIKAVNIPASDEENQMLQDLLNRRKKIRLSRNHFITTPMLIGIIRPQIIIPNIDYIEPQLKNILLHEITHLKHFDIAIKWFTMLASAIHWFNPLMYLIKKEINRACELACDEAVIKNLNIGEKQAYGETLISVAADNKYPVGVLQATMCEEKRSLKERLIAIMKHGKKSRSVVILSGVLLLIVISGAIILGAGVGKSKETPPDLFISAENLETKSAIRGTYSWSYRGTHIQADSDYPTNFEYNSENVVNVASEQQLILSNQKLKTDNKYNFTVEQISSICIGKNDSSSGTSNSFNPSFLNGDLYIQAPAETGEYIYTVVLKYGDTGTVTYGFVVRVNLPYYELSKIAKYKTPFVGDNVKVGKVADSLPVPDNYFIQKYISMETTKKPYSLTIYYEAASAEQYNGQWPIVEPDSDIEKNSRSSALVAFCMIDNLDEVTFAFRDSQSNGKLEESEYNTSFTFQRAAFEEKYGDLSRLGENLDLLRGALTGSMADNKNNETTIKNKEIERYIEKIISPGTSSNPQDYIKAHQTEYENILNMGDEALVYLLDQFKNGNNNNLRGHIMMALCKELLGERNNVKDERLLPQEWYTKFTQSLEIKIKN